MYRLDDTIIAVSSPTAERRTIIRVSGPRATVIFNQLFIPKINENQRGIIHGRITTENLTIEATAYLFAAGQSYTAERMIEIHLYSNQAVTETLIKDFLSKGARMAQAGEFTARAYFNGKIDLAQAEAVNRIVTASNRFQIIAAEKLLKGRLSEVTTAAANQLLDCLSLIEAKLDFSEEDIEFVNKTELTKQLDGIRANLQRLIGTEIAYESVIDLPTLGIAGSPNAGKSSLLNSLLGQSRSIVSQRNKTTRDILSGLIELDNNRAVIFDCAGLLTKIADKLDELTQQAAISALKEADVILFCVDTTKKDLTEDIQIRKLIPNRPIIAIATKSDIFDKERLAERLNELQKTFGLNFIAVSSVTGEGLDTLKKKMDSMILELYGPLQKNLDEGHWPAIALTARHKQAISEAIENIAEAIQCIKADNDEVAAMMLRAAYHSISSVAYEHIDEQILERIFSQFCIGK